MSNPEEQSNQHLPRSPLWKLETRLSLEAKAKELFADSHFRESLDFVAREAQSNWHTSFATARMSVISGFGQPRDLVAVHDAWAQGNRALVATILRRRTFDVFRRDARRPGHSSFTVTAESAEAVLGMFDHDLRRNPREWLEYLEGIEGVRAAVTCFAACGGHSQDQAQLLVCYFLDETPYAQLSRAFACTRVALRVRMHKAIKALTKHIIECHPELVTAG
jgi:DNA-directed RNA polymerase specialized sigma24 family protein